MSNATALIAVLFTAVVGLIVGILIADWRFGGTHFIDPEILLAARVLIGGAGLFVFGYAARSMVIRRRATNN
jgi:hypothetical protein